MWTRSDGVYRIGTGSAPECHNQDSEVGTVELGYIDAGSGSLLLQALAGGVAGVAVLGKFYWRRLKRALRFGRGGDEQDA